MSFTYIEPPQTEEKEVLVNRLVLIGNGFDLALGIKTSYQDFLMWFLKKQLLKARKSGRHRHGVTFYAGISKHPLIIVEIRTLFRNIDYEYEINNLSNFFELKKFANHCEINLNIRSIFFDRIIKHSSQLGWVNIEDIYYTLLKECLKPREYAINDLNKDLEALSKELQVYLTEINNEKKDWDFVSRSILEQLNLPFDKNELVEGGLIDPTLQHPKLTYLVNFNYTSSVGKILKYPRTTEKTVFEINHIHGKLGDKQNPIIFGFGDEHDETYKEIEDKKDNSFFEHIKSFKYLNTQNYQNLLRFLESANYQVFIYGHSCGLSDKTMLKQIFEHENCKSIKVFYYKDGETGWDDFEQKTMEISRHFDDKGLMRKLIVNKEFSRPIPQQTDHIKKE